MNPLGAVTRFDFAGIGQAVRASAGLETRRPWRDCPPRQAFFARRVGRLAGVALVLLAGHLSGGLEEHRMAADPPPIIRPQIILESPLVSLDIASAVLGINHDRVLYLIESGSIPWAFDLACQRASKRLARVLSASLVECQRPGRRQELSEAEEWAACLASIFPGMTSPTISADALAVIFRVSTDHVYNLVAERSLSFATGSRPRHGPGGSAKIEFSSVEKFLRGRRIL